MASLSLGKLGWSLLLPLALLFAQLGQLRHEYSHHGEPPTSSQKQAPAHGDPCPLCLAYAHLGGAAKSDVAAPMLLSDLVFHLAPAVELASTEREVAAPRSRGPPNPP